MTHPPHQWKQCVVPSRYVDRPGRYISFYCAECGRHDTVEVGAPEETAWRREQMAEGVTTIQRLA